VFLAAVKISIVGTSLQATASALHSCETSASSRATTGLILIDHCHDTTIQKYAALLHPLSCGREQENYLDSPLIENSIRQTQVHPGNHFHADKLNPST
jgi:hypothetical protein